MCSTLSLFTFFVPFVVQLRFSGLNPNSSLDEPAMRNQGVVGRVLTRHVGLKPDLRSNELSGISTTVTFATFCRDFAEGAHVQDRAGQRCGNRGAAAQFSAGQGRVVQGW